jgi:Helicase conserved C-terminal domain
VLIRRDRTFSAAIGNADAIVTIRVGTDRDERRRLQALFRSDPDVRIVVATDAAGEGVNLQNANLTHFGASINPDSTPGGTIVSLTPKMQIVISEW